LQALVIASPPVQTAAHAGAAPAADRAMRGVLLILNGHDAAAEGSVTCRAG
jgi:hypothetical protein